MDLRDEALAIEKKSKNGRHQLRGRPFFLYQYDSVLKSNPFTSRF